MKYIKTIQIKYFRSVYNLTFEEMSEGVTVFTGGNDVGKSNILRALNLFFNGEVDFQTPLSFERDFSKIRKQEIRESRKARQLISISVEIVTPKNFTKLSETFWVTRTFDRNNKLVEFSFDNTVSIDSKKLAVAKRLFNSIEYIYIPAVKDRDTFSQVLSMLKSNLPKLDIGEFDRFNSKLRKYGKELRDEIEKNIGLSPSLSLPTTSQELFSSLDFVIQDQFVSTALSQRGDGIRCRFIPAIMNYIALSNCGTRYIWGMEEPENSLEFLKASELNDTLETEYSSHAQILLTSHSPAFVNSINMESKKIIYLLRKNEDGKISKDIIKKDFFLDEQKSILGEELGYIYLQRNLAQCLTKGIAELKKQKKQFQTLSSQLRESQCIVYVEGPTDEGYLNQAKKYSIIMGS